MLYEVITSHNLEVLRAAPHSRFPICKGGLQNTVGVAESRGLLQAALAGEIDFAETPMIPPLYVPSVLTARASSASGAVGLMSPTTVSSRSSRVTMPSVWPNSLTTKAKVVRWSYNFV